MTEDGGRIGHLELPRPGRLLRTLGWNLVESLGLPTVGYLTGQALGGRDAGLHGFFRGATWFWPAASCSRRSTSRSSC